MRKACRESEMGKPGLGSRGPSYVPLCSQQSHAGVQYHLSGRAGMSLHGRFGSAVLWLPKMYVIHYLGEN